MTLHNKVILVTGAASGIGRATALAIAEAGGKVAISDINVAGGEETAGMITDAGGEAFFTRVDVTDYAQIDAFVQKTVDHFGGLDGAFNNAGVGGALTKLHQLEDDLWDQTLTVNLKAVWWCMKAEIPRLRDGHGSIVNMASVAGLVGFSNNAVYAASKHGVIGLTKSAALEYAKAGIRVNAVCPGFTETPMVAMIDLYRPGMVANATASSPMKRLGNPREIAAAVVWLLSDESSFVNGLAMAIDGGLTAG
ncbi:MAG TPA: SDR family oxidoreductase [Phototrophicaceae bacterium]|jgi:NAD(P)-dependent dehydrogenase (short-subunit alcohol dehydrogenase family)|nr:SDR family oxidoreductase [Phototrophicaceae bacterium]